MSSRVLAAVRATLPLSLSLTLVGCSFAYCGDDAFRRELELRHGEIAGTAFVPGPEPKPAAFVQASVRGTTFVRRTNSEGRFVFSGLAEGAWMVTVSEDIDGDGKPERRRVVSTVLREESHRTSPSYVPFVGGSGRTVLAGVDVGEVVLEGTVRVEGRVLVDGAGGALPPVERGQVAVVVAGRNLDLPRLASDGSDLVSLGAEAKTGVDDEGRFVLRNVSGGTFYLLVLVYEEGAFPGQPGALLQVSPPIEVRSEGEERVTVPADIVLPDQSAAPRRPAQVVFSPPPATSEQVYLTLVPPGLEMPPCEDAPPDYAGTPFPYALTTAQITAGGTPQFSDVPVGVWDMQACFTRSPSGKLFAQTVAPPTEDEPAVLLGPVLLSDLPSCVPSRPCELDGDCSEGFTCDADAGRCVAPEGWSDCDGDETRGLPLITSDDERAVWASCVSACFEGAGNAAADSSCDASDGNTYDCDDDGDGQPDVTEAQACYGVGKGTDSDGDGVCDGIDPFPECRANTAVDCEAGAEPDVPAVPDEYAQSGSADVCPVERAEGESWCDAVASGGGDQCPVTSMQCSFTPEDRGEGPPPPRCDANTGIGCPVGMECLVDQANEALVAPCLDVDTVECVEGCPSGFSCGEATVGDELVVACISTVGEVPDVYGTYTCQCCSPGGGCERETNGLDTFWMPGVCHDDEMQELWTRCHGQTAVDPQPPDAGPDDSGGTSLCVDLDDASDVVLPDGVECVRIVDGTLEITNQVDWAEIDFGAVRQIQGSLLIQNNDALELITAPNLEVVTGAVIIDDNAVLSTLSVPVLQRVDGDLGVWRNPFLSVQRALPPGLIVGGQTGVSANGCTGPDECTVFGTSTCAPLPGFGDGVSVCYECQDASGCDVGTCDVQYSGTAGTGTYTCGTASEAPNP